MAEKKKTAKKWDFTKDAVPFDELPIIVKRNRKNLYEYIRTGELPQFYYFFLTKKFPIK